MKIAIVGTGYVGLVSGVCFADLGNDVVCLDVDSEKVDLLNKGVVPIYEPGLKELLDRNVKAGRLKFTTNKEVAYSSSELVFVCVGTPQKHNGEADLSYVFSVAKDVSEFMNGYKVVVNKSTVPVGTAERVKRIILENAPSAVFDVVSNPEFLKEGTAIKDFQVPDRIVVGCDSERAEKLMGQLYSNIARVGKPIIFTDIKSAELIKYASNAMLATRISFMNELSHLCEVIGADVKEVAKGMGMDSGIGPRFLQAGIGYGGSCFPKDVRALAQSMEKLNLNSDILRAVDYVNERQKKSLLPKLKSFLGKLDGKKVCVWGLSFKPKTDDVREAPSISFIDQVQSEYAEVNAYDPVSMDNAKKVLKSVNFFDNMYDALKGADALVIITEWDEFRNPDFERMKKLMKQNIILDGRNIYNKEYIKEQGFQYQSVGR